MCVCVFKNSLKMAIPCEHTVKTVSREDFFVTGCNSVGIWKIPNKMRYLMRNNFLSTSIRFWSEWELQGALTTIYKHVNFLLAHFLKPFPSHAASRTSPWKVGRTGNKQGRTGENHKHEQLDDTNIILCAKTAEYSREGWVNPLWDDRKTQYLHKLVCAISY